MALHCTWSAYPWGNPTWEISGMNLCNPLLTRSIRFSVFSVHQESFLALHLRLYLSGNDTDWGAKNVRFMCLQWEEGHTYIQQLSWGLSSHGDMTVVMILSKKVSNDIKGKYAGPRWRAGGDTEVVQLWGTELTFWTTPFKASFNHHHSLLVYTICFLL